MFNSVTVDDSSKVRPGVYSANDPDDDGYKCLGFGDFVAFNTMLLALLPPDFSIQGKCLMVVTYMISVSIGLVITCRLGDFWNTWMMPAIPVPMFFITLYAILLNYVVENVSTVCPPVSD